MTSVLLDLPGPIAGKILDSWLGFKSVVAVDTAFCAHMSRKCLWSLLSTNAVLKCDTNSPYANQFLAMGWLQSRKVCVSSMFILGGLNSKATLVKSFLMRTGTTIKRLRITVQHDWSYGDLLLDTVAEYCPNVVELYLYNCSVGDSKSVAALVASCRKVTNLKINSFQYLDAALADAIISVGPNLRNLELNNAVFTSGLIPQITAACPNLLRLDVAMNRLTDENVKDLAKHCPLLRELYLAENPGISQLTDAGVVAIASLQHLQTLDLTTSQRVTDAGIVQLVELNPRLRRLYIGDNDNITDVSLFAIAKHCANLTRLEVYFCDKVTSKSVLAVATQCTKLQKVSVSSTGKITKAAIKKLGTKAELVADQFVTEW